MSSSLGRFRRPPNPVTQAAFRRQVRREVYLPIALTVLAIVLLVAVVIVVGYGTRSAWADMALVLLAVPVALLLVVLTAVLAGAIYLMLLLIRCDGDPTWCRLEGCRPAVTSPSADSRSCRGAAALAVGRSLRSSSGANEARTCLLTGVEAEGTGHLPLSLGNLPARPAGRAAGTGPSWTQVRIGLECW
jgi:hypothetical protein